MAEYRPIGENPYRVGEPVRDSKLLFGREEQLRFLREELVRPPEIGGATLVVLWGAWRTGKSSLLRQAVSGGLGPDVFPVLIDLDHTPRPRSSAGFWHMLGEQAVAVMRERGLPTAAVEAELPPERDRTPNERFRKFLQVLTGALGRPRPVFVLDGYEMLERWIHAGAIGVDVVDGLAGILDSNLAVSVLLAGVYRMDQHDPETWGRLGVRAMHRKVGFLPREEAERLVREPVAGKIEYDEGVVPAILRATACHPFLLQAVCHAVVERLIDEQRNRCTKEDLEEALDAADDEESALPLFVAWWRSLGFLGRVVASALASELEDAEAYLTLERAEAILGEDRAELALDVDRAALRGALDALVESEDLEKDAAGGYRFRADLVRLWIAEAHPVWDVARRVAEEPEAPLRRGVRQRLRQHPILWFWVVLFAVGTVLLGVRFLYPTEDERSPGPGTPLAGAEAAFARGWRLGPDLAPVPVRAEDAGTIRAEAGRVVSFRASADGSRMDVTISWPTGVPAPVAGWLDALRRPEESWLWGVIPELAPDPSWLGGADARYDRDPLPGALPPWIGDLLAPAVRLTVEYVNGYPARILAADRTGWTRAEWCVAPGRWERCVDDGSLLQRIAFTFTEQGRTRAPLLSSIRFLSRKDRPAPDALGRTELSFLYRDVDPDPEAEQWEIETVVTTYLRQRSTSAGAAPFAPPPGWQGVGTGGVALNGDRSFLFYFREDRGVGRRGGEIAALQSRDHVGRAASLELAWGPAVETIFFSREGSAEAAFFVGTDGNPAADAVGASGYLEERSATGVRTRVVLLGPDGKCAAGGRLEGGTPVDWCQAVLSGVPDAALEPTADDLARLLGPHAVTFRSASGLARDARGAAQISLRDLGPAPPPCERLVAVQHHDAAEALVAPAAGPFTGSAVTRLAVRFSEHRLADLVRTDCSDGPCAQRDVLDETWSCNENGCVLSNVPLECKAEPAAGGATP